jgi:hypothetical protein
MPGQDPSFQTPPVNIFHSRRIADPDAGLKLTGKTGRLSLGVLAAIDAARDYDFDGTIGGLEFSTLDPFAGKEVQTAVARARVDVLADGYVGASLTTRRFGNGQGTVASFDSRIRVGGNTTVRLLMARSVTDEPDVLGQVARALGHRIGDPASLAAALDSLPDGARALDQERHTGSAVQLSAEYDDRHWNFGLGVLDLTPRFETHLGFTPRADFALLTGFGSYTWQSTGFFRRIKPQLRLEEGYDHGASGKIGDLGQRTDRLVSSYLDLQLPAATSFSVGYTKAFLRIDGVSFGGLDRGFLWLSSQALGEFDFAIFARAGEEAIFSDVVDEGPPLPSSFVSLSVNTNVRPIAAVRIGIDLNAAKVWRRSASAARESRYAESAIPRVKTQIQVSKRLGLRMIGEYRSERFFERSGAVAEERNLFATDFLVTYLVYPGQSIQVGWSTLASGDLDLPLRTVARGGVAKVTYLWRF